AKDAVVVPVGDRQALHTHGGRVPDADVVVAAAGDDAAVIGDGDAGDLPTVPAAMLAKQAHEFLGLPGELLDGGNVLGIEPVQRRAHTGQQYGSANIVRRARTNTAEGEDVLA